MATVGEVYSSRVHLGFPECPCCRETDMYSRFWTNDFRLTYGWQLFPSYILKSAILERSRAHTNNVYQIEKSG